MKNKIIIQAGQIHSGKTDYCKKYLTAHKPKRALILDIKDEYHDYEILLGEKLDKFIKNPKAKGIYRALFYATTYDVRQRLYNSIVSAFGNGLLVCENIDSIFTKEPKDIIGAVYTCNNSNTDYIINYQSFSRAIHPKFLQNADLYNIYKTLTKVEKYKKRLVEHYPLFKNAQDVINTLKKQMVAIDLNKSIMLYE